MCRVFMIKLYSIPECSFFLHLAKLSKTLLLINSLKLVFTRERDHIYQKTQAICLIEVENNKVPQTWGHKELLVNTVVLAFICCQSFFGFGGSPEKIRHLTLSQSKSIHAGPTALMFNEKTLANSILSELEGHLGVLWFKNFDLHIRDLKLRKVKWLFQYHSVRSNNFLT